MLNYRSKEYGFVEADSRIPGSRRPFMYSELMEYMNNLDESDRQRVEGSERTTKKEKADY